MRVSPMPNPHRISLSKAWTTLAQHPGSLHRQRFFQKPTNLCDQTSVRLRIESQIEIQSAFLNGHPLGDSIPKSQNTNPLDAENFQEFGYDWSIASALLTRNELVLCFPTPDPLPPESLPKIDVWLEIFSP